jgi:hypothetical protein
VEGLRLGPSVRLVAELLCGVKSDSRVNALPTEEAYCPPYRNRPERRQRDCTVARQSVWLRLTGRTNGLILLQ